MFTGLVEAVGIVQSVSKRGAKGLHLLVGAPFEDTRIGDSISVSGVCVTVTDVCSGQVGFFASSETLRRSKLGSISTGTHVNLERAVRAGDRLGGHIVQGHVDEVGKVLSFERVGEESLLSIAFSSEWDALVVEKGSIAVDGISLTVADCRSGSFSVSVIPHTLEQTTLKWLKINEAVNLEFDVVAKYVAKGLQSYLPESVRSRLKADLSVEFLREHGFL
jgi:riboflavin synthase